MMSTGPLSTLLSFGEYELHLDSGELFRAGAPVKLQPQPAKVLEILARRSGEVVSREEIQAFVWGDGTFLDADASLNFCIKQIRRALDDPAASPRFVETVPRRGYRFLVPAGIRPKRQPVPQEPEPAEPVAIPEQAGSAGPVASTGRPRRQRRFLGLSAATVALAVLALFAAGQRRADREPTSTVPGVATIPPEAREHYLSALYTREADPVKAVEELRQALVLAPHSAEIHATLAWTASEYLGRPAALLLPEVQLTARRAVELDPDLSLAHLALGDVLFQYKLDWKNGETEIRRAIQLDPGHAEAWHALAKLLAGRGEHEEAIASAQRARELDPRGMVVSADLAWYLYLGRRYEEAVRQAASAIALQESGERGGPMTGREATYFRWAWRVILYSSLQTGDRRAGLEAARTLMKIHGDAEAAKRLVRVDDYWPWELRRFLSHPEAGDVRKETFASDAFASNAAAAGQTDLALSYLDVACRRRWPHLLLVAAADPLFDRLHGHPRFERFLDCIGVPAAAPSRRR